MEENLNSMGSAIWTNTMPQDTQQRLIDLRQHIEFGRIQPALDALDRWMDDEQRQGGSREWMDRALATEIAVGMMAPAAVEETVRRVLEHPLSAELFNSPQVRFEQLERHIFLSLVQRNNDDLIAWLMEHLSPIVLNNETTVALSRGCDQMAISMLPWCYDTHLNCVMWKMAVGKPNVLDALMAQSSPQSWKVMNALVSDQHPIVHAAHEKDLYFVQTTKDFSDAGALELAAMIALATNQMEMYKTLPHLVEDKQAYLHFRHFLRDTSVQSMQVFLDQHTKSLTNTDLSEVLVTLIKHAILSKNCGLMDFMVHTADNNCIEHVQTWISGDALTPSTRNASRDTIAAFEAAVLRKSLQEQLGMSERKVRAPSKM